VLVAVFVAASVGEVVDVVAGSAVAVSAGTVTADVGDTVDTGACVPCEGVAGGTPAHAVSTTAALTSSPPTRLFLENG
jgi:hypothetical protein